MFDEKIASNLMLSTMRAPWRVTVANVWLPPLGGKERNGMGNQPKTKIVGLQLARQLFTSLFS